MRIQNNKWNISFIISFGILIVILILFFQSCKRNIEEIKIVKNREICIPIEVKPWMTIRTVCYDNNDYLMYFNNNDKSIYLIDIYGKVFKKISCKNTCDKIKINGDYDDYLDSFSFADSIQSDTIEFFHYDNYFKIYNDSIIEQKKVFNNEVTLNFLEFPLIKIKEKTFIVYAFKNINTMNERLAFIRNCNIYIVNLQNNSFLVKIRHPMWYLNSIENYYDNELIRYTYNKDEKKIYYGITNSPYVYSYNFNKSKIDSNIVFSKYIKEEEIFPFDSSNYSSNNFYEKVYEYSYLCPSYRFFCFNKYLNIIFRINTHKTPYYQPDGKKTNYRNWSISVIDSNLKLIGEIPFLKDSIYDYRVFIPSENGFWLGYKQTKKDKQLKQLRLCEYKILL
ncbi:MAG: hypothetical protein HPY79_07430 [Bacteroidales bacterium]|nr:hypothetical protein [Bacteroidales bacterium]